MSDLQTYFNKWSGMSSQPKLSKNQWNMSAALGIVLVVMAVLQVVSFNGFKDALSGIGLSSSPALWAVLILIAEAWGSLGFFKIRLNNLGRALSGVLAIAVSGFWLFETLKLISEGTANQLTNSGYFGKYLPQEPGWWTVIEATVLFFWVIYTLKVMMKASK